MMTKLLFTAHWSAEEALTIFEFLDDMRDVIWSVYETDIMEIVQSEQDQSPNHQKPLDSDFNIEIEF